MTSEQNWKEHSVMAGAMMLGAAAGLAISESLNKETRKATVATLAISGLIALLPQAVELGLKYANRPSSRRVQDRKLRKIRGEASIPAAQTQYPEVDDEELYGV